jgi:1-acyl-sn-glycerol-3-phosphate acyltransferase
MKKRLPNYWYTFWRMIGIILVAPIYFRLKVIGVEHIPKTGGFILASNHRSHLDPVILGIACFRQLSYLARSNLFHPPAFSWFIRSLNAYPIHTDDVNLSALRLAIRLLQEQNAIVIFPEGTRSRSRLMGQGKPGIAMMALKSKRPVIPAWIEGTEKSFPRGTKLIKPAKVTAYFGQPIWLEDLHNKDLSRVHYDEALRRIMERIRQLGGIGEVKK